MVNSHSDEGLRIAEVVRLTGVGAHTLRAWERRYGVPVPHRTGGRQRMYSMADVDRIRQMHTLSSRGVPLARAAKAALEAVNATEAPPVAPGTLATPLAGALLNWDEPAASRCWSEALEKMDVLSVFERVAIPVLRTIGDGWHSGTVTVAQEHFATNFIRSRVESLHRHVHPLPESPIVLLACAEGERHEIALLMLAVLLRFQGMKTIYLGQDVPTAALVRTVEDSQPDVVAINATTHDTARTLEAALPQVAEAAPLAAIVFGGGAFDGSPHRPRIGQAEYAGPTISAALARINRLSRRARPGGKP